MPGGSGHDTYGGPYCGLAREIGTVQRGKIADLVVVDGDPLKDIAVLQDISRI